VLGDAHAEKPERRQRLHEALGGPSTPEPQVDAVDAVVDLALGRLRD
jgi:hypothetical protein